MFVHIKNFNSDEFTLNLNRILYFKRLREYSRSIIEYHTESSIYKQYFESDKERDIFYEKLNSIVTINNKENPSVDGIE